MKKTHWLRNTLLVLIIAGILGTILAAIQFSNANNPTYAYAAIEFSFDGAAQGLAPNGDRFDLNAVTSDEVLNTALENADLQDRYTAEQIRPQVTVTGDYPEDIVQQLMSYESLLDFSASRMLTLSEYHPTRYTISLRNDFDKGISRADLEKLLTAIVTSYRDYFIRVCSATAGSTELSYNLDDYDYVQQLNILSSTINQSAAYAQEMYEKDASFTVNGKGFNDIYVQLNTLVQSDIDRLNASITMNALTKSSDRLQTQYQYELRSLNHQLEQKQTQLKRMEDLIASYEKNEIIYLSTADSLTKIDGNSSETYDELVALRKRVADEITNIQTQIKTYQLRLQDLLGTDAAAAINEATAEETNPIKTEDATKSDSTEETEDTSETATTVIETPSDKELNARQERRERQEEILKQNIQSVLTRRTAIMQDFDELLKAYNAQEINDLTVLVTKTEFKAPKIFSGTFIVQALKTVGPFCVVAFSVCIALLIVTRRKEEKQAQKA